MTEKTLRNMKVGRGKTSLEVSFFGAVQTLIAVSLLLATLFTAFTPTNLFSGQVFDEMIAMVGDTPPAAESSATGDYTKRIGIVSGHWGYDNGSVCADGLNEQELNLRIATLVKQSLMNQDVQIDLMQEFDPQLTNYRGLAVVSIHAGSCTYAGDEESGFKIAPALGTRNSEAANELSTCIINQYISITGLEHKYNQTTPDMTNLHTFNEVDPQTPAVVIETGSMNLDRQVLTQKPELIAKGIAGGILCYINQSAIKIQETATDEPPAN